MTLKAEQQDPQMFSIKLSGLILLGLSLLFTLVFAYNALTTQWDTLSYAGQAVNFALPLAASLLCVSHYVKSRGKDRLILVREFIVTIIALLCVELLIVLFFVEPPNALLAKKKLADRLGIAFDTRTKTEVVADLRAQGLDALPSFPVGLLRRPDIKRYVPEEIYPLGNVSNAHIVECNETGEYMVYESDEHGFNNPKGFYEKGKVDLVLVGASFTHGYCVKPHQNMVARIRQVYPKTLGFGMGGGHASSTLGSLREFVEPLQPAMVIWVNIPWSMDIRTEHESPILLRYLDPNFQQNLRHRQDEVDRLLRRVTPQVEADFHRTTAQTTVNVQRQLWTGIPRLRQLRARLLPQNLLVQQQPIDTTPFQEVLRLAKKTVEGWGGKFYFVHLPFYEETVAGKMPAQFRAEYILSLVAQLGIPTINGVEAITSHVDPASLYALRSNFHLNPEGYQRLGDFILAKIQADMQTILARK